MIVLEYYGINESVEQISKNIKVYKVETYFPQKGSYLIKKGFEIEIISFHPKIFTLRDKNLETKKVINRYKSIYKKANKNDRITIKYFLNFLKDGGKVSVRIPDINDIKKEINQKRPLLALMTSNFIFGRKPGFNFHSNVITGIDNKYIYTNDPLWDNRGGKKKYLINDFIFGLYASCYGDLDNASLI